MCDSLCLFALPTLSICIDTIHVYTHTHTHIYIYIYIYISELTYWLYWKLWISIYIPHILSSSSLCAAYMRQWTGLSLVQVMAIIWVQVNGNYLNQCWLIVNSAPGNTFQWNSNRNFHPRKCIWKCRLPKWRPFCTPWRRHQMEAFSVLLALCAGNSPVTGEFTTQRPETRSFDVFFYLCLNKRFSKQSRGWWFEPLLRALWRHYNAFLAKNFFVNITDYSLIDMMQVKYWRI